VARHRSPQGRHTHLGPPLLAAAAAGVGAHRSVPARQLPASLTSLTSSTPARFVATAVAGSALAAAGQYALTEALPLASDGANVLRLGVDELLGAAPDAAAVVPVALPAESAGSPAAPVTAEPVVADAAALVKAADLQRVAAEAAARPQPAAPQTAALPAAAPAAPDLVERVAGAVQLVVGRVTSGFGSRSGAFHGGLDIAAPIGTPIRAPLAGTVIDSGPASGFGLWVRLRHADGTVTVYGHVNRSHVNVGEKVAAGEVIAEVGNRGRSSGPHLHLEVLDDSGNKINPRTWLNQHGIRF
jgi:murein DD-endopeptidase MepM/ murein hydrolase activator NlpD